MRLEAMRIREKGVRANYRAMGLWGGGAMGLWGYGAEGLWVDGSMGLGPAGLG